MTIYSCVQYCYVVLSFASYWPKTWFSLLWIMRSGHENDHSLPSEYRVYMNGAIILFPPLLWWCAQGQLWLFVKLGRQISSEWHRVKFRTAGLIFNTLRTGDANLRFYITTVQDGWRKSAFLTRACFPCTIHLTFRHRASCILGQAFHYSPENAFYILNQQIYFIIWY